MWAIICCLYDQFWSNLRYFTYLSGLRAQILATELDEDFSAPVTFLEIFFGNGRVF